MIKNVSSVYRVLYYTKRINYVIHVLSLYLCVKLATLTQLKLLLSVQCVRQVTQSHQLIKDQNVYNVIHRQNIVKNAIIVVVEKVFYAVFVPTNIDQMIQMKHVYNSNVQLIIVYLAQMMMMFVKLVLLDLQSIILVRHVIQPTNVNSLEDLIVDLVIQLLNLLRPIMILHINTLVYIADQMRKLDYLSVQKNVRNYKDGLKKQMGVYLALLFQGVYLVQNMMIQVQHIQIVYNVKMVTVWTTIKMRV